MSDQPARLKVEIYKFANRLKNKMGARFQDHQSGTLAPAMIAEADLLIKNLCADSPKVIAAHLEALAGIWQQMRDMQDSPERKALSEQVFTTAHEIKDIGSMCGYDLVAYFAKSLRDYIGRTELNVDAQVVIVQAHINAMQVVHKQGLKTDAGPQAEELKKMVKMAISKYS